MRMDMTLRQPRSRSAIPLDCYVLCGGLASVFSSAATVECNFSVASYEVSSHRLQFSHLSLAKILPFKQHNDIRRMTFIV